MANKHAKAKNPRIRAVISLVAIVVVVAVCAYLGLFGFGKGTMINYLKPWGDAISLGLDLRGGVYTVYQPEDNGDPDFDTKMESTVSILTSRLTRQGFTAVSYTHLDVYKRQPPKRCVSALKNWQARVQGKFGFRRFTPVVPKFCVGILKSWATRVRSPFTMMTTR